MPEYLDKEPDFATVERDGWQDQATAQSYAQDFAEAAAQCVPAFVKAVGAGPNKNALDLCCGHGVVAKGLHQSGANVVGLDFSPAMLEMARELVPSAAFIEGDATALPFDDGSFDIITCGFGVPHVPAPVRLFTEAKRTLKSGGRFAYSAWCGPETSLAFRSVFGAIAAHGDPAVTLPQGPGAHDYADVEVATQVLKEAGFRDVETEIVDSSWTVDDAEAPLTFFMQGTVRGGVILRGQPAENLAEIRQAVASSVMDSLGSRSPWRIPIPAIIISATA